MKRRKLTADAVLAAQPGLAGLNPGVVAAPPKPPRPADALATYAHPDDRPLIAQVQTLKRALASRGRRAQSHGDVNEGTIEHELDGGVEDGWLAWWRHFHPPFVHVGGVWKPRAIDPGEGSVDYIVQPTDGASVLVEAKSVDGGRFGRAEIPEHQQQHLEDHVRAGLPAVLVVTFRTEGLRAVCSWAHVPWRSKRGAEAIYADDVDVRALAAAPGDLVERLLGIATGGVR